MRSAVATSGSASLSLGEGITVPAGWASSQAGAGGCAAGGCTLSSAKQDPVSTGAQQRWAARSLADRLQVVRQARHRMAEHSGWFAANIAPDLPRSQADTLVTELLPLLEAMRFLERRAGSLLAPRSLGRAGRPVWLAGVQAEVHREPLGHILVIGPANFPLFLPGVQALQALVAGNAVTWKPGRGGRRVALLVAHALRESGLPRGVLHITEESVEAAQAALEREPRPDKVVFTGSATAGMQIQSTLSQHSIPSTMELSGADAVLLLPSADLELVADALAFGLRLNGGQVCMSPRRVIATADLLQQLTPLLEARLQKVDPVTLDSATAIRLRAAVEEAIAQGAHTAGQVEASAQRPLVLQQVRPEMQVARMDLFAPVVSLIAAPSTMELAAVTNSCPFGLCAAIFGQDSAARTLAAQLKVGTVLVNDLIAPTADPRVPFGGRGESGFGVTRGAEGLLEMTATKTLLVRRKGMRRHYAPVGARELPLFEALIGVLHGGPLRNRWSSLLQGFAALRSGSAAKP